MTPGVSASELRLTVEGVRQRTRMIRGRIQCKAHGGQDFNVEVKEDRDGEARFICYSRGCKSHEIRLAVLGLAPGTYSALLKQDGVSDDERRRLNREYVVKLWRESGPATGTLVAVYLRSRAIEVLPTCLRFHQRLRHPTARFFPGLIAPITHAETGRKVRGILRVWLRADGAGKCGSEPEKAMLGDCRGGAIRLAPLIGDSLIICEGLETGLSILQAVGIPVWAALSTSGLKSLVLPREVRTLTIAADADAAGERAARDAAMRFHREDPTLQIHIARPRNFQTDFNDELREG
jgi:putative DNA primase/helicase